MGMGMGMGICVSEVMIERRVTMAMAAVMTTIHTASGREGLMQ